MLPTELAVPVDALRTVGLVFAESIALYALYGVLSTALAPRLLAAVGGE
ncbi:DUF7512 family protein [Halolamina sp. C58]